MTTAREYAAEATVALRGMLPWSPVDFDEAGVLDIIEQTVQSATLARKLKERRRVAEVEAAAQALDYETRDLREGLAAARERRAPRFQDA